jgi:hypothetical protein
MDCLARTNPEAIVTIQVRDAQQTFFAVHAGSGQANPSGYHNVTIEVVQRI